MSTISRIQQCPNDGKRVPRQTPRQVVDHVLFMWVHMLGWAFIGFVPLGFSLSRLAWPGRDDISRAIAPVIAACVVLLPVASRNLTPGFPTRCGESISVTRVGEPDQGGWQRYIT